MKDYNEMAKSVFEKRDEYLIAQKKRRALLIKAGVPLCSLVLVTLASLFVWQIKLPEMPKKPIEPTINVTQQINPDDTSKNVITSADGEIKATQRSSVQAQQPPTHSEKDGGNTPKPTQNVQQGTENNPQDEKPVGSKPATNPIVPKPNTGGVVYPNSPGIMGKPTPPTAGDNSSESPVCTTLAVEESTLPEEPEYPFPDYTAPTVGEEPTVGAECTMGGNSWGDEWIEPTTSNCTDMVPDPTVPEVTGPLEITVEDKKVIAQVGDKVTYTVELMAPKRFENIQIALRYNSDYLKLVIPEDVVDKQCAKTTPNMTGAFVGYNPNVFRLVASSIAPKYDFRQKKVLFTIDFLVRKPGETECDFMVEVMSVYIGPSPSEDIHYFSYGEQLVFDGITFYHNISVN